MNLPNWISSSERILVSPLNWGLGHATRCIPIIDFLLSQGKEIQIASDGGALELLMKEYGNSIKAHQITGYNIDYKYNSMALNILSQSIKIISAIRKEHKEIEHIVTNENIDTIISDNRYGARNKATRNVIICHQLNIQGKFIFRNFGSFINSNWINKFHECWIPDNPPPNSIAANMSLPKLIQKHYYIGTLSRMKKPSRENPQRQVLVILSGPEPKRRELEEKILHRLEEFSYLLVRGTSEPMEDVDQRIVGLMTAKQLNNAISTSEVIVCRAGYSSIMDLLHLEKKAILIPTPGQTEQEYLAYQIQKKGHSRFRIIKEKDIDRIGESINSLLNSHQ